MLLEWALQWGIPYDAVRDLEARMGVTADLPTGATDTGGEAGVSNRRRLEAAHRGGRLWRNNSGAYKDKQGRWVRYGLCNESAAMNKVLKSSDLIGIYPLRITAEMVGHTVGQFWAEEAKAPGWAYTGTERERAQRAFGELVVGLGGRFEFVNR